jgi:hypothetical protein
MPPIDGLSHPKKYPAIDTFIMKESQNLRADDKQKLLEFIHTVVRAKISSQSDGSRINIDLINKKNRLKIKQFLWLKLQQYKLEV